MIVSYIENILIFIIILQIQTESGLNEVLFVSNVVETYNYSI